MAASGCQGEAKAALSGILADEDETEKESLVIAAAKGLTRIDPGNDQAITILKRILIVVNPKIPANAIEIADYMGEIGKGNEGIIGALVKVVSDKEYETVRTRLKEGKRPGHYFAPGCCHHPDYITQIPVLFEDGRYDVMRPMNIKKSPDLPEEKQKRIQGLLAEHTR